MPQEIATVEARLPNAVVVLALLHLALEISKKLRHAAAVIVPGPPPTWKPIWLVPRRVNPAASEPGQQIIRIVPTEHPLDVPVQHAVPTSETPATL